MQKKDIVRVVAEKSGLTQKTVDNVFDLFLDTIKQGLLKDGKVKLIGFGTFTIKDKNARQIIHPSTHQPLQIAASQHIGFQAAQHLRDKLKTVR